MVLPDDEGRGEEHHRVRRVLEGRRGRTVTTADATYLARACELAARSVADAAPNPPVGCVLVRDGVTLGEGWHHRRGEAHAEVEALRDAAARGADPRGATAYVSLEPCNHHGRTPPCTEALVAAGVARVVVGALDPDPRTAQGGIRRLAEAGIAVECADLPEAARLIERFAFGVENERAYLTLKMAMSLDGCVAPRRGERVQLTGTAAQERVRALRIEHDAVMVGAGTVRTDDPLLTVRPHATRRKPYVRVVACQADPIPSTSRVLAPPFGVPPDAYAPTIVLAPGGARPRFARLEPHADVVYVGGPTAMELDLRGALIALRDREITSVLCEGGPTLAGRLLAQRLVDRLVWFVAPLFLRRDDAVPVVASAGMLRPDGWRFAESERVGDDLMLTARPCSPV